MLFASVMILISLFHILLIRVNAIFLLSFIIKVPGYPSWYNIVYSEASDTVYTYRLKDDWEAGDLVIEEEKH